MTERARQIRAEVAPEALEAVVASFGDDDQTVLRELVQNARRAGSAEVDVQLRKRKGGGVLCTLRDYGEGVRDAQVLLSYGRSAWTRTEADEERPAGMGILALAGRGARIRWRRRGEAQAWRCVLDRKVLTGERAGRVVEDHALMGHGTEVQVGLRAGSVEHAHSLARHALEHQRALTGRINGEGVDRWPFGGEGERVAEQIVEGVRLVVPLEPSYQRGSSEKRDLCWHGAIASADLPRVECREAANGQTTPAMAWKVRGEVSGPSAVEMVLPGRSTARETPALDRVREAAWRLAADTMGRWIARSGHEVVVDAEDRRRAHALGVVLPPDSMQVRGYPWLAWTRGGHRGPASLAPYGAQGVRLLRRSTLPRAVETVLAHAQESYGTETGICEWDKSQVGEAWAQALEVAGAKMVAEYAPGDAGGTVKECWVQLFLEDRRGGMHEGWIPVPLAIEGDPEETWDSLEEVEVVLPEGHRYEGTTGASEIADILVESFFEPSDEYDADSHDTQRARFESEAYAKALLVVGGDRDQAVAAKVSEVVRSQVVWGVGLAGMPDRWTVIGIEGTAVHVRTGTGTPPEKLAAALEEEG